MLRDEFGLDGVASVVEIGRGGPKIQNSSGALEARNAANNAYAQLRVADATSANDALAFEQLAAVNPQVGTTFTPAITDAFKLVTLSNASPITFTIPLNASVPFVVGTRIDCVQLGAGKVTFACAGTLNSKGANKSISAQYVGVTIVKTATDTWVLIGDLIA
jgi:hypothetical protein